MSEIQKLMDALKKVERCIYIFSEEFDACFQPKTPLKSTRGLRKLSIDEIKDSDVFDSSFPAYNGIQLYESHFTEVRSEEVIDLLEDFLRHVEEEDQDEFYGLNEFFEHLGQDELSPFTFNSVSSSKKIYSINIKNEINEIKQGTPILDVSGDDLIIDYETYEIGMGTMAGIIIGKKLFWLP